MSTVTITGNVRDISRTADPAEIRFWTPVIRAGVLSTRRRKVNPDPSTGAFSIVLEAGLTSCLIGTKTYTFTTTADADLGALIALEQAIPPSSAADRLQAAVNAWATQFGDSRYASAADLAAVGGARLTQSFAGATTGMALPSVADSGQALTWVGVGGSVNTGAVNGRGAFWGAPGGAAYCSAAMAIKPTWGRMRFAYIPNAGGTTGTACIAVTSAPIANPAPANLDMALHLWSTPTGWAVTVIHNGAQTIIDSGMYQRPIPRSGDYPVESFIAFKLVGNTVHFRMPDGVLRKATDARFGSYGGANLFVESYMPATTDDIVTVFGFEGGCEAVPADLFDGPSSALTIETQFAIDAVKASVATAVHFLQSTPAATWTVNHNMGRYPAGLSVILPTGEIVEPDVVHPSITQTVITFPTPTAGRVELI